MRAFEKGGIECNMTQCESQMCNAFQFGIMAIVSF